MPPTFALVNAASSCPRRWVSPHRPRTARTDKAKIIVKKDVVYGRVHGAGLLADIAYPEGKGPFPVILSVHGGRWVGSHRRPIPAKAPST